MLTVYWSYLFLTATLNCSRNLFKTVSVKYPNVSFKYLWLLIYNQVEFLSLTSTLHHFVSQIA